MNDEGQTFEDLLQQAREVGEDEPPYWENIEILRKRGNRETLNAVLELASGDGFERNFAATVLAKFGEPRVFSLEVVNQLLDMLEVETDDDVVAALASSLGHQESQSRVFEALKTLSLHPAWKVRWPVTLALSDYKTLEAVELLIQLSTDSDEVIRDWATFGLNRQEDLDTPAVRTAFVARLEDEDAHTRAEALYGLAQLRDSRVVAAVQRESNRQPNLWDLIEDSPEYRLLPALREMAKDANYSGNKQELEATIAAFVACEAH